MKRIYAVTGATGNIGQHVARGLLEHGHAVRALGRSRDRLAPLADLGATPFVGDMREPALVAELFRGADAALLISKGSRTARDYRGEFAAAGRNYAHAAEATGLKHAVFISSLGAHDERNRGLILMHGDVENILNGVRGLDVLHLRAAPFFENLLYFLQPMRERGVLSSPIAPTAPIDLAPTRDYAEVALRRLLALDFSGKSAIELHGQPGVTLSGVADIIARALDRPFPAERADREADIETMVKAGVGRDFANLMNDTWEALSRRPLRQDEPTAQSRMPSRIESFVRERIIPAILAEPQPQKAAA